MDQDNKEVNNFQAYLKHKFRTNKWLSFKNEHNGIEFKFYLNQEFYQEQKANLRRFHPNRRNSINNSSHSAQNTPIVNTNTISDAKKGCDPIYQASIPNTVICLVTFTHQGLGTRVYNCNWTKDGKSLLVTSQKGISMFGFSDSNQLELTKAISCEAIKWAITDSDLSSDNKFMIHSTLGPNIQIFDLENSKYSHQFILKNPNQNEDNLWLSTLRVYSLKLSGDNKECVVGCSRSKSGAPIEVIDLEANKVKHSIIGHLDDINSLSYINKEESSTFLSASDDGVCKLWDTRVIENNKPVGIFYGHVAGLTYVTSKEDNHYFITNCKDQSMKLWDLRKSTTEKINYPFFKYDYRYQILGPEHIEEIKKCQKKVDQSVMSFWGHQVQLTLIRCHFSPLYGTGQRYVYTGSYDGRVYIYDTISGENVACLEPPNSQPDSVNISVIRDCAWHPFSQTFVSSSFLGEIHKWEYSDVRNATQIDVNPEEAIGKSHDVNFLLQQPHCDLESARLQNK